MNDASTTTEMDGLGEIGFREVSGIGSFANDHARVDSQTLCELSVADIDGVRPSAHLARQAISEPARRRSDVDGNHASRLRDQGAKRLERGSSLSPRADEASWVGSR